MDVEGANRAKVREFIEGAVALLVAFAVLALIAFGWVYNETNIRRDECSAFWTNTGYRTEFEEGPAACYVVLKDGHRVPLSKFEVTP